MQIKLDEKYVIENYEWGYSLCDTSVTKLKKRPNGIDGLFYPKTWWFGTVSQALGKYARLVTDESVDTFTLKEYIAEYQKQVERIVGLLPEIKEKT